MKRDIKRGRDKKNALIPIIFIALLVVPLVPLVSAGFFTDIWNKITGRATSTVSVNITVGATSITTVFNGTTTPSDLPSVTLNSGPAATGIQINFTASNGAGFANLNYTTATMNFSKSGESTRLNASCFKDASSGNLANFSCNVTMFWYDAAGTWNIGTSIFDNNSNFAFNNTAVFQIGSVTGFQSSPSSLTWGAIGAGSYNQTSNNDPLIMNNTGNQNVGINAGDTNISVNATDLVGETTPSLKIFSGNFSISNTGNTSTCSGATCYECGGTNSTTLSNGNFANLSKAILPKGNFTARDNVTGVELLFFCIRFAGAELTSQAYSTLAGGAWTIKI